MSAWLAFSGTGVSVVEADDMERAHDRAMAQVAERFTRRGLRPPDDDEVRVRPTDLDELRSLGLVSR